MKRLVLITVLLPLVTTGCFREKFKVTRADRFGKIYYLDGAGNLGFGTDTVDQGLRAAGFRGDVEVFRWTTYTGPLGDQLIRQNARLRSKRLTKRIVHYRKRFPHTPLSIIGLSAGTGVATWAIEALPRDMMIDNLVLLGSSLSSTYDMTECLSHVTGKIYVVYSDRDAVLIGFIPVTGTIDGQYLVSPAGQVGLRVPNSGDRGLYREKVVNIPWRPRFENYGYTGGHTDATSTGFIRHVVAPTMLGIGKRPVSPPTPPKPAEPPATQPAS